MEAIGNNIDNMLVAREPLATAIMRVASLVQKESR